MKRTDAMPLGYIVSDSLEKVYEHQYRLKLQGKNNFESNVFVNLENGGEITYGAYYDLYTKLKLQQKLAVDDKIIAFVKKAK